MSRKLFSMSILLLSSLLLFLNVAYKKSSAVKVKQALSSSAQEISPTQVTTSITPTLTTTVTTTPIPTAKIIPPVSGSKILFGIGSQAGPAMDFTIVKEAPMHMLTSWYNKTSDLEWMQVQKNDLIPRLYANKYVVHLITWTDLPEETIQTPYGEACGRPYPVSSQVVEDMKKLSEIYNGPGPMYVSLFTEFQSYTCIDNNWSGNENYWKTLQDNFRKIKDIFHANAPNSKVGLSWGGWSGLYNDEENQGGRALFKYFESILRESDFNSFQAMESESNVEEIIDMTKILGSYGRPVMLSHYKPSNHSQEVFNADLNKIFSDEVMSELTRNGLFALSFMDDDMLENETSYQIVKNGVVKYGN